ncbi:hypothetical protein G6F57_021046 [Rhizopus arrhizus]|nr:hypothetical protein G6F57_021046 [Rhizopus arrhizus]
MWEFYRNTEPASRARIVCCRHQHSAPAGSSMHAAASHRFARKPSASTLGTPSKEPAAIPSLNIATNSAVAASTASGAARIIQA